MPRDNKIEKYALGNKVLELRKTLTCAEVAQVINRKYLPKNAKPLSTMAISRYCSSKGITDIENKGVSKAIYFDSLEEAHKVRDRVIKHENRLVDVYNNLKENEEKLSELASISNAILNTYRLHQELNERVSKIQKEQLGLEKVRKALRLLLNTLDKYPEVKAQFFTELRNAEEYDIIKSI